jgi:branched-chain amino acid transport system ATP-binding protein
MEALKVENLSKSFGGVQALLNVSFSLDVGETLVIIGPNGAGKTTLVNLVNGHLLPTAGRILFFGRDITTMPTHRRARLGMARSFQLTTLFLGLTVLENILLALGDIGPIRINKMIHSITAYKRWFAKAEEFLRAVDLWEKRDVLVQNIGYGEQRKLEILLCLVSKPKLLLLDEPSCGLTSAESADLIDKIYHLGKDIPVVIVSHDMDLVFGVADRIIVLHHGRVAAAGLPEEIKADSIVKEIYMGIEGDIGIVTAP